MMDWRTASTCEGGACVVVGYDPDTDTVHIRDSKHMDGPFLVFTREEWTVFCDAVRAGEFDLHTS